MNLPEIEHEASGEPGYSPVTLSLARTSIDLWPALEAAQFARLVNRDPPTGEAQASAMQTFIAIFTELAESWDSVPVASRMPTLEGIDRYLVRMRDNGIHVHAAAAACAFTAPGATPQSLPLAVLNLGGARSPELTLMVPHAIDVTDR